MAKAILKGITIFQSTLPVWGATVAETTTYIKYEFQSTLPVWGATPDITAPLSAKEFQSTLPVWGATC